MKHTKQRLFLLLTLLCALFLLSSCSSNEILSIDEEETAYFLTEYAKEIRYIEETHGITVTTLDKNVVQHIAEGATACCSGMLSSEEYRFLDMVSEVGSAISSGKEHDYGSYLLNFFAN